MSNEHDSNEHDKAGHLGPADLPVLSGQVGSRQVDVQSDSIDTIRDLLRKLEDAASEAPLPSKADADAQAAEELKQSITELSTLRRSGAIAVRGAELVPLPVGVRPIEIDVRPVSMLERGADVRSRSRGAAWAIGVGSFALGVVVAGGVLVAFDPFNVWKREVPAIVAQAPVRETSVREAERVARDNAAEPGIGQAQGVGPGAKSSEASISEPALRQEVSINTGSSGPVSTGATVGGSDAARSNSSGSTSVGAPTEPYKAKPAVDALQVPVGQVPVGQVLAGGSAPAPVPFAITAASRIELRAGELRSLSLRIEPEPKDTDAVLVVLRGVPGWLSLSKGSTISDEVWLLPAHNLGHNAGELTLQAGEGAIGTADIKLQLAHLDGRILAETTTTVRATRPPPSAPMVARAPEASQESLLRMLARGELLLDTGEIEAARLLLRTAAEGGSVAAALKLAQTYDPAEMQRFGMAETSADPVMAVRWYERAQALGSPAAAARLSALSAR